MFLLRAALYASLIVLAILFGVFWVVAAVLVWGVDSLIARNRNQAAPKLSIPLRRSDERVGKTAAVFVGLLLLLVLLSGGDDERSDPAPSGTPVEANRPAGEADAAAREETDAEVAEPAAARRAERLQARRARARRLRARRARIRRARAADRRAEAAERRKREREEAALLADREADEQETPTEPQEEEGGGQCHPSYDPCVPPAPPDLDCGDVSGPITVSGDDPHGFDADGDGVGCES